MENPMENPAATLRANLANLAGRDAEFARSLLDQLARRGSLSDKQMPYLAQLAARATGAEPARPTVKVGDMAGLIALLRRAGEHLKFPKIRLQTEDGRPVSLAIAGPQSRQPGTITVTDGGPFGANTFYGRVTPAGEWQPRDAGDASVTALLTAMSAAPAETAAAYGKLTGNCCFCARKLSDERSTSVGYGATCAEHYSLPWG